MIGFGPGAVFLCDTPTSAITDAELKILLQRHPKTPIMSKRWLRPRSSEPLARFTVRLPSSDRKLKQYGPWLRANHDRKDNLPDPDDPTRDADMVVLSWRHPAFEDYRLHHRTRACDESSRISMKRLCHRAAWRIRYFSF